MRAVAAVWISVAALAGCGGGAGDDARARAQLEIGPGDTPDSTIASGRLQQRTLILRNGSDATARGLRVSVTLDPNVLQLPLSCSSDATSACTVGEDGSLQIAELAAGTSMTLRQQLRVKPGFSGVVNNDWTVSSADAALSAQWQQALNAYAVDVGLTLQSVTVSGDGSVSYDLLLSNAGPDAARNIEWHQIPGIDMSWLGATCSASGGAVCPSSLGASIKVAQLSKGASLRLVVNYSGRSGAVGAGTEFLASEVQAAGDTNASNDRLLAPPATVRPFSAQDGPYDVVDLQGHAWTMILDASPNGDRELHIAGAKLDAFADLPVDVTGAIYIRLASDTSSSLWTGDGTLQLARSLLVGSFNFGRGLQPFLAARDWVTNLSELEGIDYLVMGSQTDQNGKSLDSYARAARFTGGALQLCESDTPTTLDACPASQLRSYQAAVVGSELELMSSTEVLHLRAVRTGSGPVLLRSERASDDSGATFWIGVPKSQDTFSPPLYGFSLIMSTFASATGLAAPTPFTIDSYPQSPITFSGGGLPNGYLLYSQAYGLDSCQVGGTVQPGVLAGLDQGILNAYNAAGTFCYQGPIYFAQTSELVVLLGNKSGPLGGSWLITTE